MIDLAEIEKAHMLDCSFILLLTFLLTVQKRLKVPFLMQDLKLLFHALKKQQQDHLAIIRTIYHLIF